MKEGGDLVAEAPGYGIEHQLELRGKPVLCFKDVVAKCRHRVPLEIQEHGIVLSGAPTAK